MGQIGGQKSLSVSTLRGAIVWFDPSGTGRAALDGVFARIMRNPLAPLLLAIPIGIAFSLDPRWINVMGVRTPDQSLITNVQAWIGFGIAFGVGWLLHRQVDLLRLLERRWLSHLLIALGLILISFVLVGVMTSAPGAPKLPFSFATLRLVSAILYAPAIWISSFAAIGLALRFMSGFSPTRRYLADASYWLYLIHMPIVMTLQVALSQRDWPGLIKFAIILVVAIPPMLASYHLLVRFTFIGAVLNGRRAEKRVLPQGGIATA
ncbi:acyltransferase family protein [Bradyrhizobium sp. AZCC 2230]|uniref:acyltransferase family protein n=1 Tax=Bradyrhizobium sp. AZCC 2230 TaxID=3117021 RepID=UPI002FEEB933